MKKRISLVIPVFNEAANIPRMFEALTRVFNAEPYDMEVIFVNDGSEDGSQAEIEKLAVDKRVKGVEFSRNFGKEIATTAGIAHARGDAVIVIDADLQHPPAVVPEFLRRWEQGAEVVIGVRRPRRGEGFLRRAGSRVFSRIMNSIGHIDAPSGSTDFRLIDRKVADVFSSLREHRRLTRSLIDWLGFKRVYVAFDANERDQGGTRYSYGKLFSTAGSAIIAHSRVPLQLAGYLGIAITLLAGVLGVFVIVEQIILGDPLGVEVSGTAMLAIMILFLNGIVLISLGLIALYIGTIHEETAERPLYVIRQRINLED